MNKVLLTGFTCLTIIGLNAQTPVQSAYPFSSCEQITATYGDALQSTEVDQHTIASVARCHIQMLDNLQAARWFEKIADLQECKPEYLLEYAQCLKSLKLYGKAKFYFQKYAQYDPVNGNHFMQSCDIAKIMLDSEPIYEVSTLTSNTPSAEYAPFMAGGKLTFNTWHSASPSTSVYTIDGADGSRQPLRNDIPDADAITHVRYSGEGKTVVFASNGCIPGQRLYFETPGTEIYLAEVMSSGKWGKVTPMKFRSDTYAVGYPSLSVDGTEMYFASTMPGGHGGWDVYVSRRNEGTWSKPENLGTAVNTPGNEISPFIADDILYFSSDWHPGIGGFDVFMSTFSAKEWGMARPIGYPVNSPKDDIDFTWVADAGCAYFSSNRIGVVGSYDLYKAVPQFREIQVNVMHKETMNPLDNATLSMSPGTAMAYYTDAHGIVTIQQPLAGEREILIKKEGYQEHKVALVPTSKSYQVYLNPIPTSVSQATVIQKDKEVQPEEKKETKPVVAAPANTQVTQVEKPVSKQVSVQQPRTQEMFFIQIAALARHSSLEPYADLKTYGDLILHDDGTYSKVRVGAFATEPEAKIVLARVKSGGYPDAFVVKKSVETGVQKTTQSMSHVSEYKVRLGTYAKVGSFDPSHVMHLGAIESYRKDDLTIMLLGGYENLTAAKEARDAAASHGFADAYVVMDRGGILERVR